MSKIMARLRGWLSGLWGRLARSTPLPSGRSPSGLRPKFTVAVGLCLWGSGRFLAQRRPGPAYEGHWELPGGKVELGESPSETVVREWWEEIGLDVRAGDLLADVLVPTDYGLTRVYLYRVHRVDGRQAPRSQEGGVLASLTPFEMARRCTVPSWGYLRDAVVLALAAG